MRMNEWDDNTHCYVSPKLEKGKKAMLLWIFQKREKQKAL